MRVCENVKQTDLKTNDSRISYFQNVPIGSPSTNLNHNILFSLVQKKNQTGFDEKEINKKLNGETFKLTETNVEKYEDDEKEMPRIRHNRKQW